jgi:hypothetical protein
MSKYIEDLQGGKFIHDRKEDAELSKLDGYQIYWMKLAKIWSTVVASVIIVLIVAITVNSVVNRIEIGHSITTTKTEQTVNYPEKVSESVTAVSGPIPGYDCQPYQNYIVCQKETK